MTKADARVYWSAIVTGFVCGLMQFGAGFLPSHRERYRQMERWARETGEG